MSTLKMSVILLISAILLQPGLSLAKIIKVAVIDSGYDFKGKWTLQPKLCATGHKDFTGTGLQDNYVHGTHIAGLIAKYSGNTDYCLIIIKFYDPKEVNANTVKNSTSAIYYAISQGVDVINYSAGGVEYNSFERKAVLSALEANITVIAAAGNEGKGFSEQTYYPALYDARIVVVGNIDSNGDRVLSSNYGPQVDVNEIGKDVLSLAPGNRYAYMTGTSQSTAIHTGKTVQQLYNMKKLYSDTEPKYLKRPIAILA